MMIRIKKCFIGSAIILTASNGLCLAETTETPEMIQKQADALREGGKTLEALNLYNEAIMSFQQKHDYDGILGALAGRLMAWEHLFTHEDDKVYAILARKEAEAMLAIAEDHGIHDRDYLIHFLSGKSCMILKDFKCAEIEFKKAVDLFPNDSAEKGNWIAHYAEAVYQNGRKEEGESLLLSGIQQMQVHANDTDAYKINFWKSGAYLRFAKILIDDHHVEQGKFYLHKGEAIILNDSRLAHRKPQVELLKKEIDQMISEDFVKLKQ